MNIINNKNQTDNQKLSSPLLNKEDRETTSYYEHYRKRQVELAKQRKKATLNNILFSLNI